MKRFKPIISRTILMVLFFAIQLATIFTIAWNFKDCFTYYYAFDTLLRVIFVIKIANDDSNPGYKIAWIIPVAFVPIFGGLIYVIFGSQTLKKKTIAKMTRISSDAYKTLNLKDNTVSKKLEDEDKTAFVQSNYINKFANFPVYDNTYTEYLPSGEIKFQKMLEELEKAKKFIFIEYFIIGEGIMWNSILEILKKKAEQGVDVRVIYDSFGSIEVLPLKYEKKLESMGIKCAVFNPFVPVLDVRLNNRDHRKICVIDGNVGFTGGINLADEYINAYELHGHWKDTAILLKGDAVWSLTVMFLTMWDYLKNSQTDILNFRGTSHEKYENAGYIQPYSDNPMDSEPVGETVYLNIINKVVDYLYITTPYLIIDNTMLSALCSAAKAGIDVKIITPHIPDKKYVHAVTRSYYEKLIGSGVEIYEYTPGFIHAKTFVADDKYGIVGTINMDYRSLFLHFECATWLYKTKCVGEIKEDFLKTLEVCEKITIEQCKKIPWYKRATCGILKILAPLM